MFQTELIKAMTAMGWILTEKQTKQFCLFQDMLLETNKVMNLTAITEPADVAVKHMADSLSCYDKTYFAPHARVLDLGTGAGFPGLPLLIYQPDLQMTFFDSLQKRLRFIQEVLQQVGLQAACMAGQKKWPIRRPIGNSLTS